MLKIAICEDNKIHAEMITTIIKENLKLPFQAFIFHSGTELMASCQNTPFDFHIVCMDISLNKDSISGIQFAQKINQQNPDTQIIFISQFLEYASSVYEVEHIYFVYKNKIEIYLPKALEAAIKNWEKKKNQYLEFNFNQMHYRILQKDIFYLERNLHTTYIHTRDKHIYTTALKLQELEKQLLSYFCQCHRSFLVNLHTIRTINRNCAILCDNTYIPIGRNYYTEIKKKFLLL